MKPYHIETWVGEKAWRYGVVWLGSRWALVDARRTILTREFRSLGVRTKKASPGSLLNGPSTGSRAQLLNYALYLTGLGSHKPGVTNEHDCLEVRATWSEHYMGMMAAKEFGWDKPDNDPDINIFLVE